MYGRFDKRGGGAFSLVEVTLALGLLTFALVALLALLPNGLTSSLDASRQSAADAVAAHVLADLRAASAQSSPQVSAIYGVDLSKDFSRVWVNAAGEVRTGAETADFLVEVSCASAPADGNARTGSVRVRWPASAAEPTSGLSYFFAY
jgi:uncharacterized protein (TIGR02598 family)